MNNPFEIIESRLGNIENLLLDLKHSPLNSTEQTESDRWYNINELMHYLPDKPAKQTVYGLVSRRKIPFHKGQKKLRFLKSEIDQWLMTGRHKTRFEIKEEAGKYLVDKRKGGNK